MKTLLEGMKKLDVVTVLPSRPTTSRTITRTRGVGCDSSNTLPSATIFSMMTMLLFFSSSLLPTSRSRILVSAATTVRNGSRPYGAAFVAAKEKTRTFHDTRQEQKDVPDGREIRPICKLLNTPARLMSSGNYENNYHDQYDLITSTQSTTVKRIKILLQKRKKRLELGQTVVEGPRIVFDLLRHPKTRHLIKTIVMEESKANEYVPELESIQSSLDLDDEEEAPWTVLMATRQVMSACSDTVTPQGIVATVDIPSFSNGFEQHDGNSYEAAAPLYLVLDGVADPGNTGTLLRTAVATGVTAVFQLPGCCDIWNPKAIRSAMSASFLVPSYSMGSWEETQNYLTQELGVQRIWAATMVEGSSKDASWPHYNVDWCRAPTALVIGSEGSGLSAHVRESLGQSTHLKAVHVPMNEGIESLNAAVCGSVIMFEYLRQCHQPQPHQD